jgi:DNA-binding GntR family transcriptional regulator
MHLVEPERPKSAILRLVDELRDAIIKGEYEAGQPIRQETVAATHKVSRTPVREAFRLLEAEGWIEQQPYCGAVVAPLDPDDVIELFDVRAALETLGIQRSFPRLSSAHIAALEAAHKAMNAASTEIELEAHQKFHLALHGAAGSRLQKLIRAQLDAAQRYLRLERSTLAVSDIDRAEHAALLAAARERDVSRGIEIIRSHVGGGGHSIARSLRASKLVSSAGSRRRRA